jgi:two-component system, OmpR family, alkaline phosphatase synthesis response regulator PhoP
MSSVPPPRPSSGVRPRGPLVLVVAESTDTRELYSAELAAAGFMVLEASDGAAAIEKALRFGPHAVVLDLLLPGIDGFKVARKLRGEDRTSDVAILAVAPRGDRLDVVARAAGCDSFLAKPVLGAALVGEIVRLLAAKRSVADLTRVKR